MVRRSPLLAVVLALLLSLQWGSAFAHCLATMGLATTGLATMGLAAPGTGGAVEICTTEGIRTLHLDAEGQPAEPGPAAHDSCPLCPAGAVATVAAPSLPAVRLA
ncbi:MAG: hypothetical protein JWP04_974, partial [Belnapia sp.]|nr:hypothetical protein [Belnapia sp.]